MTKWTKILCITENKPFFWTLKRNYPIKAKQFILVKNTESLSANVPISTLIFLNAIYISDYYSKIWDIRLEESEIKVNGKYYMHPIVIVGCFKNGKESIFNDESNLYSYITIFCLWQEVRKISTLKYQCFSSQSAFTLYIKNHCDSKKIINDIIHYIKATLRTISIDEEKYKTLFQKIQRLSSNKQHKNEIQNFLNNFTIQGIHQIIRRIEK